MPTNENQKKLQDSFEEILTGEDLDKLIESKAGLKHYIGFEISGKVHLGTGLVSMLKIKELQNFGVKTTVFLADWHSWINEKLDGTLKTIREVAEGYFKEAMIASLKCVGAKVKEVEFVLGSELYHQHDDYWATVIEVSKNTSLSRMRRSITILGRKEGDDTPFAQLIYPPMQVADIIFQGVNLAHAGMDQRKAHVILRDTWNFVRPELKSSYKSDFLSLKVKPVALHHHLILGLQKPPVWPVPQESLQELWSEMKMSKSKPDSAIFIHDSEDEIRAKIKKAFCPPKETVYNPILDWVKNLIFPLAGKIEIIRKPEHGGSKTYESFESLKEDYASEKLHPDDLKAGTADSLIKILKPARDHFSEGKPQKSLEQLEKLLKRKV